MPGATANRPQGPLWILPPGVFRLVLALAVVSSHITRYETGRIAVLLFFLLSGYWVTKVWKEKFAGRAIPWFYAARYLRIAPLYLLAMLGAAFALHVALHPENLTLLGVASTLRDPLGVAWSLDVELQFYLLLPFIAGILMRPSWQTLLLSIVLAVLGWEAKARFGVVTAFQYLPAFAVGGLAYAKAWRPTDGQAALSLAVFAVDTVFVAMTPLLTTRTGLPMDRDIFGFFWALPLVPYVVRSLNQASGRWDRHAGNLSYPLYLVHAPLIFWALGRFGGGGIIKVSAAAAAFLLAVLIYAVIDRPVDGLRVRLTERPRAKVRAAD